MATKRNNTLIDWPATGHFTIEDLQQKYPSMVNITLRFRVKKALDANEITAIGKIKPAIGRPKLVFVKGLATKEAIETALKSGVLPLENKSVVSTADVKTEKKVAKTSPAPTVDAKPIHATV
jgi:hypothetical protein